MLTSLLSFALLLPVASAEDKIADGLITPAALTTALPAPRPIATCAQETALRSPLIAGRASALKDIVSKNRNGLFYVGDPHVANGWEERRYQELVREISAAQTGKKCLFLEQNEDPMQVTLEACNRSSLRRYDKDIGRPYLKAVSAS